MINRFIIDQRLHHRFEEAFIDRVRRLTRSAARRIGRR